MLLENIVQKSTQELLPITPVLPFVVRGAFSGFHWIHATWHWYQQGKTYLNPNNFLKLASGHTLNFFVGDNRYVRLAAQCVMISNCILQCVKEQTGLNRSYSKLMDAFFLRHPSVTVHKWNKHPISPFISPSTSQRIYGFFFEIGSYLKHVGYRIAMFAKHFFNLSMSTLKAVDAFSLNPEIGNQAVNEFFVNGNNCLDAIAENRDEMIEKLHENKPVIDCVLKSVGATCKAEQLIEYMDNSFAKVQNASKMVDDLNKTVGTYVTEAFKTLVFMVMTPLGAADAIPDILIPEIYKNDDGLLDERNRFAPVCRLNVSKNIPADLPLFPKINRVNKTPFSVKEAYENALRNNH